MSKFSVTRPGWIVALLLILIATVVWWSFPARKAANDVPIIIYLVDTLRVDRLGIYGYSNRQTSPVIDALAAESVIFDQAYAPAPWTVPSVASLITSTFACEHGVLSERDKLSDEQQTLAERLAGIGYLTLGIYANAFVGPISALDRGYRISEPKELLIEGVSVMGERAERLLDRTTDDRFLLYVHTTEPHDAFRTANDFTRVFGHVSVDQREAFKQALTKYRGLIGADWPKKQPRGTTDNTDERRQVERQLTALLEPIDILYDASVLAADTNLGDFIERMKRRGVWDQAIFIFISDHGEEFDEHGAWFHEQSVYEEIARVPMLIRFPDGEFAGRRIRRPVSLVDVMPTLFDYLGRLELCSDCRGVSLMPDISGNATEEAGALSVVTMRDDRRFFIRELDELRGNVNIVVRKGRWKGIWNDVPGRLELYDLETDPSEQTDLSGQEPEVVAELARYGRRWLETCRAGKQATQDAGELDDATRERLKALGYVY